jgi:hypothetical protein
MNMGLTLRPAWRSRSAPSLEVSLCAQLGGLARGWGFQGLARGWGFQGLARGQQQRCRRPAWRSRSPGLPLWASRPARPGPEHSSPPRPSPGPAQAQPRPSPGPAQAQRPARSSRSRPRAARSGAGCPRLPPLPQLLAKSSLPSPTSLDRPAAPLARCARRSRVLGARGRDYELSSEPQRQALSHHSEARFSAQVACEGSGRQRASSGHLGRVGSELAVGTWVGSRVLGLQL